MNICRICETIDNLLCSLNDPENSLIIEMLTDLANVSYSNDDQLPKFLCQKCQKSLKFAIEFKRQCEMTDRKLRRLSIKLLRTAVDETEDVKHYTSTDEDFQNNEIENYDADVFKVEYLEQELISNSNDIKEEDIFLLQESTEIEDASERISSVQSFAVELQIQEPNVFMIKEKCNFCNNSFESISALKRHTTTKHKPPNRNKPKEDRSESHHDSKFSCFYCNNMFITNKQLEKHVRKEHCSSEVRTFQCFDCKREFKNRKNFLSHYTNMHSGNSFECNICLKSFTVVYNLRRHLRIVHDGIKLYKCPICPKHFGQKFTLDEHIARHSENRPFQCEECEYAGKTALNLKLHKMNKHSDAITKTKTKRKTNSNVYNTTTTCEYCGKQMRTCTYYSHVRQHTGEKPYLCKYCPKTFTNKANLVNHTYVHTGEYPYNCNLCDRKFRQLPHLVNHTLTHTGERPHQCTFCDRKFALRVNLKAHTRIHTGETPYHCSECSEKFGDSKAFKRHQRIHNT